MFNYDKTQYLNDADYLYQSYEFKEISHEVKDTENWGNYTQIIYHDEANNKYWALDFLSPHNDMPAFTQKESEFDEEAYITEVEPYEVMVTKFKKIGESVCIKPPESTSNYECKIDISGL